MSRDELIAWAVYVLFILLTVGVIGLSLYVLITYGGKPITEIPAWAAWFFLRR